ncbi:uncharacterized protein Dvir_GJ26367 [Drosophila virilis]|uniref:Uncharacterized protein n=1 Tax=Drosophila virilis TaxID=7244 RepID=A0A0Q9WTX9_DROVI|nr:uncharacterized protein Dvir_GJ26367 [Drosophila virilis]
MMLLVPKIPIVLVGRCRQRGFDAVDDVEANSKSKQNQECRVVLCDIIKMNIRLYLPSRGDGAVDIWRPHVCSRLMAEDAIAIIRRQSRAVDVAAAAGFDVNSNSNVNAVAPSNLNVIMMLP